VQYTYVEEVPDEILEQAPRVPSADQILDKYIQALGGTQSVAALTSFAGKGTYEGYDTGHDEVPVEVFGQAPAQRATIIHTRDGDSISAYDGHTAWIAAPEEMKPLPLIALTGGELDGARIEAQMFFPSGIKQFLQEWRVGPPFMIEDRQTDVVQGKMTPGGLPVKLYFDRQTNLLLRLERYTDSPLGIVPTQIDYSDYRVVSGVKIPFHLVTTWTDGQSTIALSEVKTNVPIDATKFAKPTPSRGPIGR
jgi:outer membrane lipoprotein-sorting protein